MGETNSPSVAHVGIPRVTEGESIYIYSMLIYVHSTSLKEDDLSVLTQHLNLTEYETFIVLIILWTSFPFFIRVPDEPVFVSICIFSVGVTSGLFLFLLEKLPLHAWVSAF